MPQLRVVDSGVIYRNPNPGYQYVFACHSHLVRLSAEELLCTYQRGQALYSTDSVIAQARSTDGGRTWDDEGLSYNPAGDSRRYSYHGPHATRLSDGKLALVALRIDRSNPKQPLFNEATGGMVRSETLILRTADGGRSWSEPEVVDVPPGMILTHSSPLVELATGEWFLSCDQWHAYEDPGPYRPRTVGLLSADAGHTWGQPVTFADGGAAGKGFWHGRILRLGDDRLYTLFWSAATSSQENLCLHACWGNRDGRNWSTPTETNLRGQTNWPAELTAGRLVAIYTVRESTTPGFYAALSTDGGKTWDVDQQLHVWDASGRDKLGVHAPDTYPRSHDTIAFGAPTALALNERQVICSFWCTEMSVTQIRYVRLRID